uniref:Uncharacterized protein n=1 Tax=Sus scrofa TaxID=9823 RepID=A0A8D0ME23_PIG
MGLPEERGRSGRGSRAREEAGARSWARSWSPPLATGELSPHPFTPVPPLPPDTFHLLVPLQKGSNRAGSHPGVLR